MSYELHNEIVPVTMTTLERLTVLGVDALALYMFYVKTTVRQATDKVYATDSFCMKGLSLSRVRFFRAKKLLVANRLIEQVRKRVEETKVFQGFYIKVCYLLTQESQSLESETLDSQCADIHTVAKPHSGKTTTNALDNKKRNAVNKKEMLRVATENSVTPPLSQPTKRKLGQKEIKALLLHFFQEAGNRDNPSAQVVKARSILLRQGVPEEHVADSLQAFAAYWLETGPGTEHRFMDKKHKYFTVELRLVTWGKRDISYNGKRYQEQASTYTPPF